MTDSGIAIVAAVVAAVSSMISFGVAAYSVIHRENKAAVSKVAERRSEFIDLYRSKALEFVNLVTEIRFSENPVSSSEKIRFFKLANEIELLTPSRHKELIEKLVENLRSLAKIVFSEDANQTVLTRVAEESGLFSTDQSNKNEPHQSDLVPSIRDFSEANDRAISLFCQVIAQVVQLEDLRVEKALVGKLIA